MKLKRFWFDLRNQYFSSSLLKHPFSDESACLCVKSIYNAKEN